MPRYMAQRCTKHLKTTSKTRPHYPHSLNSSSTSSSPLLTSKGTFDAKKNWVSELTLARVAFLTKMYGSGASPTTLPSTESEALREWPTTRPGSQAGMPTQGS